MTFLTEPLHRHHKYCDDLFAKTEVVVADRDWVRGPVLFDDFHVEIEKHFRTEEVTLFPAFEAVIGMTSGPTQMMRLEHAQMRSLLEKMRSSLDGQESSAFAGAAETLLILMQQHNMKEENILYPMCDRSLTLHAEELGPVVRQHLNAPPGGNLSDVPKRTLVNGRDLQPPEPLEKSKRPALPRRQAMVEGVM